MEVSGIDNREPQKPPLVIIGSSSFPFDRDSRRLESEFAARNAHPFFPLSRVSDFKYNEIIGCHEIRRELEAASGRRGRSPLSRRINRELSIDEVESSRKPKEEQARQNGERGGGGGYPCRSRGPGGLAERRFWLIAFAEKRR